MNLFAFTRDFAIGDGRAVARRGRNPISAAQAAGIEPLEQRIAPATLVSPTTVSFQDKNGDAVTVTISKSLFTTANVGTLFTFDTGSVNGDNTVQQQLETLDLTSLGSAAKGVDITITATPVNNSLGVVDVGYINASNIDLGNVTVGGDLGRIAVGDTNHSTQALHSLTVGSMGVQGLATQAAGGNLNTLIAGPVGAITINGDINGASAGGESIGIGGGSHGTLGSLTVKGSIIGGTADFSGSVRTQGTIANVEVDGSITGGGGMNSGAIGTAGSLGTVLVKGSVTGGGGSFSGAILSTNSMTSVTIDGDLSGGGGPNSGEVGTAANLGTVTVEGSVFGGGGTLSGVILATGNIGSVTVDNGLIGGGGPDSGQIGAGKNVTSVTIGSAGISLPVFKVKPLDGTFQGIEAGEGSSSGTVLVGGKIGSVTINGDINLPVNDGTATLKTSQVSGAGAISAGGNIQSVYVYGGVYYGGILSGGSIGSVTIGASFAESSEIHAHQNIGSVQVNIETQQSSVIHTLAVPGFTPSFGEGIDNSSILADNGTIGSIEAGGSGFFSAYAINNASIAAGGAISSIVASSNGASAAVNSTDVFALSIGHIEGYAQNGTGIANSTFTATQGIGDINGISVGGGDTTDTGYGISGSIFQAGASIASITAQTAAGTTDTNLPISGTAIETSGFDAGGNIGPIQAIGSIDGSMFVAGINLGSGFSTTGAGGFNNTIATGIGFGGINSHTAAHIGAITVSDVPGGADALINQSTFLAGVHGSGADATFGTKDDSVPRGSTIGAITSPGGLSVDFFESGSIGATTSGALISAVYVTTDTGAAAGMALVTITLPASATPLATTNADGGGLHTDAGLTTGEGMLNTKFISNGSIAGINITVDGTRNNGQNAGIAASTIQAANSIGPITINNNETGTTGHNYGIVNSTITAGVNGNGGIGNITVQLNDDSADGNTTAISNSTFNAGNGNIGAIVAFDADFASETTAGIVDSVFRAHGNIGDITSTMSNTSTQVPAVQGSTFSAFGSIGNLLITGAVMGDNIAPSRFLAGYDIGSDMTFGNEDLTANSAALQGGQHIGNVTVTGFFEGSDIVASINPGSGYIFGDSTFGSAATNDSQVGAGGSIGLVNVATQVTGEFGFGGDHAASHGIEAKTFALGSNSTPMVGAYGSTSTVPNVIFVDGGSNDVRVTNLTLVST
jgi:hypothetical protein